MTFYVLTIFFRFLGMQDDHTLKAIRYQRGSLSILDQLKLPDESIYIPINSVDDAWKIIHTMSIRGMNEKKSMTKCLINSLVSRYSRSISS